MKKALLILLLLTGVSTPSFSSNTGVCDRLYNSFERRLRDYEAVLGIYGENSDEALYLEFKLDGLWHSYTNCIGGCSIA